MIVPDKDKVSLVVGKCFLPLYVQIDEYRERCVEATERNEVYKVNWQFCLLMLTYGFSPGDVSPTRIAKDV